MIKIKTKKAGLSLFDFVLLAIIAIVIGGVIIFIVPRGLFAQEKNINLLSSCKNQGGLCKPIGCGVNEREFFKLGCPFDEDGNGKIDEVEKNKEYCCIPKEKPIDKKT